MSDKILRDFSSKAKKSAQSTCSIIKIGHKAVYATVRSLEAEFSVFDKRFSPGPIASFASKLFDQFGEQGKEHINPVLLSKAISGTVEVPELKGARTPVEQWCEIEEKRLSGVGKTEDDMAYKAVVLKRHIIKSSSSIRDIMSKIVHIITAGNSIVEPEVNYVYELMSRYDWREGASSVYDTLDEK